MAVESSVDGIRTWKFHGWSIESKKTIAMRSEERLELCTSYELPHIPLPEIVFGENFLSLKHESSGWKVQFNAKDALASWATQQRQDLHSTVTSYDVMYTCDYLGTLEWKVHDTSHEIPFDKLRQHSSILFYDHVSLFEDDIRDLGEVDMSVKIRVMEFGFLVLCRYFGRMDDKLIKLRDAVYYHEFGSNQVLRQFEVRETTPQNLHRLCQSHDAISREDVEEIRFVPTADMVYAHITPMTRFTHAFKLIPS